MNSSSRFSVGPARPGGYRLRDAGYVARRLGVPRSWVYRAARTGELPSVRCGRYRRFDDRDIEQWIEMQRAAGGGSADR